MHLTTFTDYGLRTLMYLAAEPDKLCSVREVAEHYDISRNHLVKVVHKLSQLGYVASTKEKGGGIRLARDPGDLYLGDLISSLEPNMNVVECFSEETNTCKVSSSCQLKYFLGDANQAFIRSLNSHTLADTVPDRELFLQPLKFV